LANVRGLDEHGLLNRGFDCRLNGSESGDFARRCGSGVTCGPVSIVVGGNLSKMKGSLHSR